MDPPTGAAMRAKLKLLCFWLDIRCKRPADSEWLALMTPSFNRGEQKELGTAVSRLFRSRFRHFHNHLPWILLFSVSVGLHSSYNDLNIWIHTSVYFLDVVQLGAQCN